MPLSVLKDPPVRGTRQRGRSQIVATTSYWRVRIARIGFAVLTAGAAATTLLLLLISIGTDTYWAVKWHLLLVDCIVPLAFIITLPGLCACTISKF